MYCYSNMWHYTDYIDPHPNNTFRYSEHIIFDIVFKSHILIKGDQLHKCLDDKMKLCFTQLEHGFPIDRIDWKLFNLDGLKKYFLDNSYELF